MMQERDWESAVRKPLASAAADARVLVLVEGEAGTGKTRFVRWLLGLPEHREMPRLIVTFTASGASVRQEPAPPDGSAPQRPAASLAELAASLGSGAPHRLLVAENVHRADEQDASALRALLARPPAGLRTVLTCRPEELARPGLALGAPVGYPAELALIPLRLGPLSRAEVSRLAVQALGEDRCSAQFITRLHQHSGGIAQVAADLVAQIRTAGPPSATSTTAIGREWLTARDVDEAPVPLRLGELVAGRMAALDTQQRHVVWAAAVLDQTADEEELTSVAALPADDGRAALAAALSEAVLCELAPGRYGFRVPMAATALYRLLPSLDRRDLHGRAADLLAARRPVPWERLARHQFACGRIPDWLESVEHAARDAAEAGNHQLAISLLEDALAHPCMPQSKRARLALMLARSAVVGLRSDQTVELLRRVVDDHAVPVGARGEIRLDLGMLLGNQLGRSAEGRIELLRSVDELASRPGLAARAMAALALPYWPDGTLADNLTWLARAEAAAAEAGDTAVQAAVAANRTTVLLSVGDPQGWRLLERLPREHDDLRILQHSARGVGNAVDSALWLGEYRRAHELLSEFVRLNARAQGQYWGQGAQGSSLLLDLMTGRWAGLTSRARAHVVEAGDSDARLVLGLLALAKGDRAQSGACLSAADLAGDGVGVPRVAAASGARIRLALTRDDLTGALREATEAWDRMQHKAVWVWAADLAPWAVEAATRAGESAIAREMVDEFAAGLQGRQAPSATAALARCRALLAEADGDLSSAAEFFRHARTRYQTLPRPYEAALAAERAGRCTLAVNPEDAAGIAELDAATRELDALGAAWDAARVRAKLRAHQPAERRPPGRPGYGELLSPREQEVADLAGAGLSNREIAATLHLSPRTVEQHVARALKKSGVLSRHDLARVDTDGRQAG